MVVQSDKAVVKDRIDEKHTAAFPSFVEEHRDCLHRFLCRKLHGADDVADLEQEVFLRAQEALAGFEARSQARTWLLSIAHHVVVDYYRKLTTSSTLAALW